VRRISSSTTFFYKRIFPILWFGILGVTLLVALKDGAEGLPSVLLPLGMMAFGYLIMRLLIFDMLDQVLDDGDALVLKNGGKEERIALSDIDSVSYSTFVSPPRVVLALRRPTIFGDKVAFGAPLTGLPLIKSEVVTDLIARVEKARRS
jgi:hypothetical protein